MDKQYTISEQTKERIQNLFDKTTSGNGSPTTIRKNPDVTIMVISWDSGYKLGTCVITEYDWSTFTWVEYLQELICHDINDVDLVVGKRYEGKWSGPEHIQTRETPLAAIDWVCVEVPMVDTFECYNGSIIYQTQWHKVLGIYDTEAECLGDTD